MAINNELYFLTRQLTKINKSIMKIRNEYTTQQLNPDGSYKTINYKPDDEKELNKLLSERRKVRNEIKRKYPSNPATKLLMFDLVGAFYK